jgi:peptide-methionine (S)-S-oxide reductase
MTMRKQPRLSAATLLLTWLLTVAPAGATQPAADGLAEAVFAGGCFWCMEPPYDELDGVHETTSGYMGGHVKNPTYQQVTSGTTGHAEVVKVTYDPSVIGYDRLLEVFWRNIDPLTEDRQFCDRGSQYRSAIFYANDEQRALAEASKQALEASGRFKEPVVTEIVAAGPFYPAEDYHQNYYQKNPVRYKFYRYNCGRDQRLQKLWGDEPFEITVVR